MIRFILTFISILLSVKIVGVKYSSWLSLLIFTVILVIINATVKPIIKFLTWPINFLTLGLFHLVLNVAFLYLISLLTPDFVFASIWQTMIFGLVLSIIQWIFTKFKI